MVANNTFPENLYYRVSVIPIQVPPLRERRADVELLATHFLKKYAGAAQKSILRIAPESLVALRGYDWPGNVCELENTIERAVALGESDQILPEDLPESVVDAAPTPSPAGAYQTSVGGAKRESILRAWADAGGDYKAAAKLLGLHPNSLLRLIRNLGLRDILKG